MLQHPEFESNITDFAAMLHQFLQNKQTSSGSDSQTGKTRANDGSTALVRSDRATSRRRNIAGAETRRARGAADRVGSGSRVGWHLGWRARGKADRDGGSGAWN